MKKFGFSLSELIIAIGVIGIIAAITTPLASNIMPDKNKATILKIYKTLADTTDDLLSDPRSFYQPSNVNCLGLGCVSEPQMAEYKTKYGMLLADRLHLIAPAKSTNSSVTFTTADGVKWEISMITSQDSNNMRIGNGTVTLDFDTSAPTKCSYSSECTKPNQFILNVDTNGKVTGGDPLTRAYLANPYKLNDHKNDLKTAAAELKKK